MEKEEISGKVLDWHVLKRLFSFTKPYMGRFIFLVVLTLLVAVLSPIRPLVVTYIIDHQIFTGDFDGLVVMTLVLVGLLVLNAIVQYLHTYESGWMGQHIINDIRIKLFRHINALRLRFFDKTPIGRLVTRNISDVETLSDVFSQGIAAMIGDLLQIFIILGFMFSINWQLTLVSLATFPLLILSTYIFKEKIKVAFNKVRNAVANLNTFVQEHITGMNIVQIFNNEDREAKKFRSINNDHLKANLNSVMYYSIYFPVAEIIQASSIGLLVWYGAKGVLGGGTTVGEITGFILYIQMFFRPIRMIADRFNTLQMGIVSTNRIINLLDSTEQIPDEGKYAPGSDFKGKVEFKNVWFAYNEEEYVLKNINFSVDAGSSLALVGATGAGKSSIINLLTRFYDINKGSILIDDIEIREYKLEKLRQHIGLVLQDVFLFSDTIFENITLRNHNITRNQVMEAAELVGAHRFIEKLPGGLDYNVMERGATLSTGQRQLISFVRAMVYNPDIIILDEATSSVDSEIEELIQSAIEKMMKGRTSIVIAHRLSTIQKANNIIVLDKGEIKEAGTHRELLKANGFYAQLHQMQYSNVAAG